jgi:hypothetical protein
MSTLERETVNALMDAAELLRMVQVRVQDPTYDSRLTHRFVNDALALIESILEKGR